jgi:hypothetical protein
MNARGETVIWREIEFGITFPKNDDGRFLETI